LSQFPQPLSLTLLTVVCNENNLFVGGDVTIDPSTKLSPDELAASLVEGIGGGDEKFHGFAKIKRSS
jgi:hypothetical protein